MTKKTDEDLLKLVESEIRKVFSHPETTNKERLAAAGLVLNALQVRHKIEGGDKPKGFFDK